MPIPGFGIEKNVRDPGIRDPGITIPNDKRLLEIIIPKNAVYCFRSLLQTLTYIRRYYKQLNSDQNSKLFFHKRHGQRMHDRVDFESNITATFILYTLAAYAICFCLLKPTFLLRYFVSYEILHSVYRNLTPDTDAGCRKVQR